MNGPVQNPPVEPQAAQTQAPEATQAPAAGETKHTPGQAMREIWAGSERAVQHLGSELKKPTSGGVLAGAAVVGAAMLFGVAEAAVGVAFGYVVYRTLKRRRAQAA